ncbi:MAG: YCII-related protein [Frankiales bacterium]|nr:YCII-related protein [Frankiales bacterium]
MQFLMLVCVDREPVAPQEGVPDVEEWVSTHDASGVRVVGDRVAPARAAKVVRVRDAKRIVTDGPFLETKEVLAGFDVLECRDMEHAIEVAAGHPMAWGGVIELRALPTD